MRSSTTVSHPSPPLPPQTPFFFSATVASWTLAAVLLAGVPMLGAPAPASAISGGGLDYAELNLTGKDFSNGKYKSKVLCDAIHRQDRSTMIQKSILFLSLFVRWFNLYRGEGW